MTAIAKLGIANSYVAKQTNLDGPLTLNDTLSVKGGLVNGYQSSASTTPTISAGTTVLLLTGGTTATCAFSSPVTGQTIFVANQNSGDCTLGAFTLTTNHGGLAVYNGSAWVKFIDGTSS